MRRARNHPAFTTLRARLLLALGFARCHYCKRLRRYFVMWHVDLAGVPIPIPVTCADCYRPGADLDAWDAAQEREVREL